MKIYFGLADANTEDLDGLFEHKGNNYYFYLECGTNPGGLDDFVIVDTCNRSVPIGVSQLDEFQEAFNILKSHIDNIKEGEKSKELLESDHAEATFDW